MLSLGLEVHIANKTVSNGDWKKHVEKQLEDEAQFNLFVFNYVCCLYSLGLHPGELRNHHHETTLLSPSAQSPSESLPLESLSSPSYQMNCLMN